MENNIKNVTKTRAYRALGILVLRLLKEQKGMIIGFSIFSLILLFLPMFVLNENFLNDLLGGEMTSSNFYNSGVESLYTWVTWIPSLAITLVFLPMVHQQIFSSSISKRLKASGISTLTYTLVMTGSFALTATITFWVLSIISQTIYSSSISVFEFNINWVTFLIVTPIIWISFSSTGILIGNLKIPEIVKGIAIFFIIAIIVLTSVTVLNENNLDLYDIAGIKYRNTMFLINPWGLMIHTVNSTLLPKSNDQSFMIVSILISIIMSINLLLITVLVVDLKK